jgi:hypothetical protein
MGLRFGVTALVVAAWLFALGCAEGMPGPNEIGARLPLGNASGQFPVMVPDAGAVPPPPVEMKPAMMAGPPCMMGDRVDCVCSDGVMTGVHLCKGNPASPTKGSLGPCEQCKPPPVMEPPDAGMGDVTMAGAGGSTSPAASGSGGSAGMSGSGGMGGMGGSMMPMCVAADCPRATGLFGIEREKCCTRRGQCGGINALSGDCETN